MLTTKLLNFYFKWPKIDEFQKPPLKIDGFSQTRTNRAPAVKDLSRVKTGCKSVTLQLYFEIAGLSSAKKWQEIQKKAGEEHF